MTNVRWGARSAEELEALRKAKENVPEVWSEALTAIWRTDPDVVAAVLPPPLEAPDDPLVRATVTRVEMGEYVFGAGYFAVRARHEGTEGEYPLTMPMTTERATIGGREVFGEPKKIGEVVASRDGDEVTGTFTRHGITYLELRGRVVETLDTPPERTKLDFYFKALPAPDGNGFDHDPSLVYCHKSERHRLLERVEGEVILRESPFDPVIDLPVLELVEMTWSERSTDQRGEIKQTVPGDALLPYLHQRYDDPMQAFDKPMAAKR